MCVAVGVWGCVGVGMWGCVGIGVRGWVGIGVKADIGNGMIQPGGGRPGGVFAGRGKGIPCLSKGKDPWQPHLEGPGSVVEGREMVCLVWGERGSGDSYG